MSVVDQYNSDLVNEANVIARRGASSGKHLKFELTELLVNEGIPTDLAGRVAADTLRDMIAAKKKEGIQRMMYGVLLIGLGIVCMLFRFFLKTGPVFPTGLILFGSVRVIVGYFRSSSDEL